jgi:hypothetical protein
MMHWVDPNCLPQMQGAVEGFITNWHGEIDGVLVTARQTLLLVCTPPHMAAEIEVAVKIGETISIRGIRPRRADIIAAVALAASDGQTIIDNGPPHGDEHDSRHRDIKPDRMDAEGVVRLSLFGPKGELRGALLEDGTVIRIGPKEAASLAALLRPGSFIAVRGDGLQAKHGRVIAAEEVGPDRQNLKSIRVAKKKDEPKLKKRRDDEPAHFGAAGPMA